MLMTSENCLTHANHFEDLYFLLFALLQCVLPFFKLPEWLKTFLHTPNDSEKMSSLHRRGFTNKLKCDAEWKERKAYFYEKQFRGKLSNIKCEREHKMLYIRGNLIRGEKF